MNLTTSKLIESVGPLRSS